MMDGEREGIQMGLEEEQRENMQFKHGVDYS